MSEQQQQAMACPHCGATNLYLLGDGRHKCGGCQKKFSASARRSRLATGAEEEIIKGFAEGAAALSVAASAGVNPKTVQLYYGKIRELLASHREGYLAERYGVSEITPSVFAGMVAGSGWRNTSPMACIVADGPEIAMFFVRGEEGVSAAIDPSTVAGWIVAADRRAMEGVNLDKINCVAASGGSGERARSFWASAKRRLAAYHGGFRQHFHLYLREMEFRENMKGAQAIREYVKSLLAKNSINAIGENDA